MLKQIFVLIIILLSIPIFFPYIPFRTIATGGGFICSNVNDASGTSNTVTMNCNVSNTYQNDFLLVFIADFTGNTVTGITDNAPTPSTYTLVQRSDTRIDTEIWIAQCTSCLITGTLSLAVKATFSPTSISIINVEEVTGLISQIPYNITTGSGTGVTNIQLTTPVPTPLLNSFCVISSGMTTSTITNPTLTSAIPFQLDRVRERGAIADWEAIAYRTNWNSIFDRSFGFETIGTTFVSGASNLNAWDTILACFDGGPSSTTTTKTVSIIDEGFFPTYIIVFALGGILLFGIITRKSITEKKSQ